MGKLIYRVSGKAGSPGGDAVEKRANPGHMLRKTKDQGTRNQKRQGGAYDYLRVEGQLPEGTVSQDVQDHQEDVYKRQTWDNVLIMAIVVGITAICVFLMSKPISAYQMGEAYAKNMGLNVQVFRILLVLLSSVLSACVTAFAGPVSFVGIAVPHLVKNLFGTAKPILMIPACFLGGAAFCLFCDLLARTMFAPTELSISTVTAVFGAPVVIYIMIHRKKERAE